MGERERERKPRRPQRLRKMKEADKGGKKERVRVCVCVYRSPPINHDPCEATVVAAAATAAAAVLCRRMMIRVGRCMCPEHQF